MWNAEADAELIRLKNAGRSFGQIAKQMNVTRNAAISRFQRIRRAERQAKLHRQAEELRREFATSLTRKDRNFRDRKSVV